MFEKLKSSSAGTIRGGALICYDSLYEIWNLDLKKWRAISTHTQIQPALEDFNFSNIKRSHKE